MKRELKVHFKICHTLKRHTSKLLVPSALALACAATAQAQSNYGCTVLLCLANPAGPTAAPACVPSITQLWWDLPLRDSFELARHIWRVPPAEHARARREHCDAMICMCDFMP